MQTGQTKSVLSQHNYEYDDRKYSVNSWGGWKYKQDNKEYDKTTGSL